MEYSLTPDEVRDARQKLGMTQEAMSLELGMNQDAVRSWERGRNPCRGPAVLAIKYLLERVA